MQLEEEKIELDVITEDVQTLNEDTKVTKDQLAGMLGVDTGVINNMRGDTWNKMFKLALRQTMGKVENNDFDHDPAWAVIEWYWREVCRKPLAAIKDAKEALRSLCAQNQQPLDNNPLFKVMQNLLTLNGSFTFNNNNLRVINDLFADSYFLLSDFRKQDLFALKLLVNDRLYADRDYSEIAEIIKTYDKLAKKSEALGKNAIIQNNDEANNMLTNIRSNGATFEFDGSEAYVKANDKTAQLKNKNLDPINGTIRPISDIRAIADAYEAQQGTKEYDRLFVVSYGNEVKKEKALQKDDKPPLYGAKFSNLHLEQGQIFKLYYKDEDDNTNLITQADQKSSIWEFINDKNRVLADVSIDIDVIVDNSGDLESLVAKKHEGGVDTSNKNDQEISKSKKETDAQAQQANQSADTEKKDTETKAETAMSKFEQALLATYNNQKKQGHATTKLDAMIHDGKVDSAKAKALEDDIKEFDKALSTLEKADPETYPADGHDSKVAEYLVKKVYDNWKMPANQAQPTLNRFGIR